MVGHVGASQVEICAKLLRKRECVRKKQILVREAEPRWAERVMWQPFRKGGKGVSKLCEGMKIGSWRPREREPPERC